MLLLKKILCYAALFNFGIAFGQSGIGTQTPEAKLHIEPSSKASPTGTDGIIIPRMADYPGNGLQEGQMIYLKNHPTDNEGFYFWDGTTWVWLVNAYDRIIDDATYVISGIGFTGTSNSRTVNLSNLEAFNTAGFSVNNNVVTIGKTGKYLATFTSSVKRFQDSPNTPLQQANFVYTLFKNGTVLPGVTGRVKASTANEIPTATSAAFSTIIDLEVGDELNVGIVKSIETPNNYQGYGPNTLTLTFLRN